MISESKRTFKRLSALDQLASLRSGRPMDVCLVTSEIVGPAGAGGIGTASTALAKQLVAEGHQVTVLFTQVWGGQPFCGTSTWDNWVDQYGKMGVTLTHIPHQGDYADWQAKSWLVMQFLKARPYDLVYLNEHHASGYYALCAKRARMAPFVDQTYCVITHGSMEWVLRHNDQYMHRPSDLIMIGMERRCVEWADYVIGPSEYLLQEYARYGWQIGDKAYVHPYPLIRHPVPSDERSLPVDELVFMGRLETRKGLWLFCDAIEQIAPKLRGKRVTFMGRMAEAGGVSVGALLAARAARWPFAVRFATWFTTRQALDYLQRPGKLAVMPSLSDNSPCVVYECIEKGIPFIATSGSGAEELVAPQRRADVLVPASVGPLAQKIEAALTHGAKLGALAFEPAKVLAGWRAWHNWLSVERGRQEGSEAAGPAVSGTAPEKDAVLLNVMIDDGTCDLAKLLGNLRTQAQTLGLTAGHLVLTSRGGDFKHRLSSLLQDMADANDAPILVCGAEDAEQALEILLDADVAFVSGAEYVVDLSFFMRSAALLTSGSASAVSCFVAQAAGNEGPPQLRSGELPCGDVPAVAATQAPLASPVWAVSVPALRDQLATLTIHDASTAQFVPAETLGQRLIHRCVLAEKKYLLLPLVGAHREGPKARDAGHWYRDLGAIAQDLGVTTRLYPNAPAWLAMSALARPQSAATSASSGLPAALSEHLNTDPSQSPVERARKLALRIGRPYLAARLSLAGGASENLLDASTDAAGKSRISGKRDLLEPLLVALEHREASQAPASPDEANTAAPKAVAGAHRARSLEPDKSLAGKSLAGKAALLHVRDAAGLPQFGAVVAEALQTLRTDGALICHNRGASSARLTLVDVPLDRQDCLSIAASSTDGTIDWQVTIVDQLQGGTVVKRAVRCGAGEQQHISVALPKMLGVLMITIEITKRSSAGLKIESVTMA